jgi:hypothetical protein
MHISEREPSQFVPERVVASFEHPSVPFQPRPAYVIGPDIRSDGRKRPIASRVAKLVQLYA